MRSAVQKLTLQPAVHRFSQKILSIEQDTELIGKYSFDAALRDSRRRPPSRRIAQRAFPGHQGFRKPDWSPALRCALMGAGVGNRDGRGSSPTVDPDDLRR